ncbi:hypothetical protein [Saccharicrinis aurantiacus]|uniref:hypothetical protein n=1 Tax=Saccharicrinis aurantiacus TaxID=1849719 RepID=UPI00249132A5|nr:hypothetical protein [Saccharicrinis aurantiacus]
MDWQVPIANKPNKDIQDYYLLLPSKLFDCERIKEINQEERNSRIILKDLKNGYVDYKGSFDFSIALFKDRLNERDLIAVSSNSSGRGTSCGGLNMIIEYNKDSAKWYYRNDLLPNRKEIKPYYDKFYKDPIDALSYPVVPRHGLIIEYRDESQDGIIYQVKWSGQKFELINNTH